LKLKSFGNGAQLKLAAWRMCSFEQEIYTPLWNPSFRSRQREMGPAFVFGIAFHGPLLERPHEDESRLGRDSNTERRSAFQEIAELALGKMPCVTFQQEAPALLGDPPRKHKFDLP